MLKLIAVDTETGGLDWWTKDQQAFMVTWSDAKGDYVWAEGDSKTAWGKFLKALEAADGVIMHNAKFDLHQLRETCGLDLLEMGLEIYDTELLAKCLVPQGQGGAGGYGLKNLAKLHLARNNDTEDRIKELGQSIGLRTLKQSGAHRKVWEAYPQAMADYAMDDTRFTYDLYMALMDKHADSKLLEVYELERQVLPILLRAEQRGVMVNPATVKKLRAKYVRQVNAHHKALIAEFGAFPIDGNEDDWDGPETTKTEALRSALLEHGVPLYRKTDTDILSTNKFALQEFEKDYPILAVLREWRTASKFIATYLDPMKGTDVVHTSFRQIGAWTGRMSCTRPNMQNLPKGDDGVRSVFVPRPGHALVVCDYASIEAFLLAYYLGDPDYRVRVAEEDPHAWMASMIHYGNGSHEDEFQKGTKGQPERDKAKNTTYAIAYGAGAPRVTDMNNMNPEPFYGPDHPAIRAARAVGKDWPREGWQCAEARSLINTVKDALPGFKSLQRRIRSKIKNDGYVSTYFGRKQIVGKDKAYVGLNALIQGTAADIQKRGMVAAQAAYEQQGLDATILLAVHDEIVVECPKKQAKHVLATTIAAMIEGGDADLNPQLQVEGNTTTTHYGDAK